MPYISLATFVVCVVLQAIAISICLRMIAAEHSRIGWSLAAAVIVLLSIYYIHDSVGSPDGLFAAPYPAAKDILVLGFSGLLLAGVAMAAPTIRRLSASNNSLRLSQKRLELLLDTSPDATFLSRLSDRVIVYTNQRAEELFEAEPGDLIGRVATSLMANADLVADKIRSVTEADGFYHWETEFVTLKGHIFPALSSGIGFAKQSGGHLAIYSEPGHGTTAKLYLPRATDSGVPEREVHAHSDHGLAPIKILVVEDDPDVRELTAAMLSNLGHEIVQAEDGNTAISLLRANPDVALLLTDVVLPGGMSGTQTVAAARQANPDIKFVFMSGYTENAIIHQGKLDDGVILLQKPFRQADMARKIAEAMET